ncbi:hypothetical protein H5S40_03495 [Limosilactobacillus sp. RRLNB_1_1]|uniref:Uncharacterized protein n=1 Tax=Limosilactobacillus albertensis TaxID=2759752 RepID=A0A7W3TQU3_9LACO|nr:hypothetical protein [Limosilactobacillus albertensis]MBB1069218.1 hypothetical protein [Limosilactobacillus albertensis]MCD7118484.1 hypothetical protein [Limosilactobacillus albertensis]MCD7128627.1 hypothetical protein [Limosilactobacillus albertensis]
MVDEVNNFNQVSESYVKLINDYANELLDQFESNKKARAFLREQLANTANPETHEFIFLMIKQLEQIALSQ